MKDGFCRMVPKGDPVNGMQPTSIVPPEAFTTDDKTEIGHAFFSTDDEKTTAGVWECAPTVEEFDDYPDHEMITVLAGSVTLTDERGESDTFTSGDTFFIVKGSKIRWEITEKLWKFYMVSK
jgi:uncharacterized cupin superfamily protein